MARKDTVDINASGKKITIKDVYASNMRTDSSKKPEIKKPEDYANDVVKQYAEDEEAGTKDYNAMDQYFTKNDAEYKKLSDAEKKKQIDSILKGTKGSKYGASLKTTEAKVVTKKNNGGTL